MEGLSSSQVVTNEGAILSHLSALATTHSPVRISPAQPGSSWKIDSLIQDVQPQSNSLLLHKPEARAWSHLKDCQEELEVSCVTPNGVIEFTSSYLPSAMPRLESTLRFELPEKLVKSQRRAYHRVKVGHLESKVILQIQKHLQLTGACLDLSVAGALICIPRGKRGVDLGESIDHCVINIKDLVTVRQPVKVCSIGSKRGKLLVGVQFLDISSEGADMLRKTLNRIECQINNT
ncbi:MAG: PilZ domain-containing protein [Pseudomonadales bacterium]|nr:PilZ domain-containing protein [Pseudomonadales bacterium]